MRVVTAQARVEFRVVSRGVERRLGLVTIATPRASQRCQQRPRNVTFMVARHFRLLRIREVAGRAATLGDWAVDERVLGELDVAAGGGAGRLG
jgi:hypothetical protein